MKVKIALIGSSDFCNRTEKLVKSYNDIQLECYQYTDPKQAPRLIASMKPSDVILFSGSLPFIYANNITKSLPIPVLYLKQDEMAVAITLLRLATEKAVDLNRISIDITDNIYIEHVVNDIAQSKVFPNVHILQEGESLQEITSFHETLARNGYTDMAITSVHAVYEQLKSAGIPTTKMIDPESSILQSIELAKQQAILHKSNSAQIAVGIVHKRISTANPIDFVTQLSSILQARWSEMNDVFTLYTTLGNIESALKDENFLTLFESAAPTIRLAFGSGETIVDATENAKFALEFIKKNVESSFYILDRSKKLRGPFPQTNTSVKMNVDEPIFLEMSEKTKLGPTNISKLLQFSQVRQTKQFTATDLALYLDVSRRTAERTLKKLLAYNYASIVGEEMTYRQGRPRAIYEFNFPTYR